MDRDRVGEALRLFGEAGRLYDGRLRESAGDEWSAEERSLWDGLVVFLDGYAFERQRRDPRFPAAAVQIARELRGEGAALADARTAEEAWSRFTAKLKGADLDPKSNPMAPRGTGYSLRGQPAETRGLSAFELAGTLDTSIVAFVRLLLGEDRARMVFDRLRTVNGVGPKIASFFMRDTALVDGLEPATDRFLLQPVDIWIERTARRLWFGADARLSSETVGRRIVAECGSLGLSPERVNAGIWYFAARIARSEARLSQALADPGVFRAMLEREASRSEPRAS